MQLAIGYLVVSRKSELPTYMMSVSLIGFDFLQSNGCQVSLQDQALVVEDKKVPPSEVSNATST